MTQQEILAACSLRKEAFVKKAPVEEAKPVAAMSEEDIQAARNEAWRKKMSEDSGNVTSLDPLVYFVYHLLINDMTPGAMEGVVREIEEVFEEMASKVIESDETQNVVFTNGFVASYAKNIVFRLLQTQQNLVAKMMGVEPPNLSGDTEGFKDHAMTLLNALFDKRSKPKEEAEKPE